MKPFALRALIQIPPLQGKFWKKCCRLRAVQSIMWNEFVVWVKSSVDQGPTHENHQYSLNPCWQYLQESDLMPSDWVVIFCSNISCGVHVRRLASWLTLRSLLRRNGTADFQDFSSEKNLIKPKMFYKATPCPVEIRIRRL